MLESCKVHVDNLFAAVWDLHSRQKELEYPELLAHLKVLTARFTHLTRSIPVAAMQDYIVLPFSVGKEGPEWLRTKLDPAISHMDSLLQIKIKVSNPKRRIMGQFNSDAEQSSSLLKRIQTQVSRHDHRVSEVLESFCAQKRLWEPQSLTEPKSFPHKVSALLSYMNNGI